MIESYDKDTVTRLGKAGVVYNGFVEYKTHKKRRAWERLAEQCEKFWYGDQWSREHKQLLESQNRPPSTFNVILPVIDLILGHQIQGRSDLIAKPFDKYADAQIASIITAVFKHIESFNDLDAENKWQFMDGIITGVGIKEIWYDTEKDIEGDIKTQHFTPWIYYLDPDSTDYKYRDGRKLYKEQWLPASDIRRMYGAKVANKLHRPTTPEESGNMPINHVKSSWDNSSDDYGMSSYHQPDEFQTEAQLHGYDNKHGMYHVVEQYEKCYNTVDVYYDSETQEVVRIDELSEEEKAMVQGLTRKKTYEFIHLTTIVADEIVAVDEDMEEEEFHQLFSMFFPYWFNGMYFGVIKNLIYPQQEINKRRSTATHILNSHGNSSIIAEEGAFTVDTKADMANLMAQTGSVMEVNEGMLDKWKERVPAQVPPDYYRQGEESRSDVKYISGAGDAIQGISQRQQSGRAKENEVAQSSVRLEPIIDNFRITQKQDGRAFIWHIQNDYPDNKLVRIYGSDPAGQEEDIILNEQNMDAVYNDVTVGKYDVVLSFEGKTQTERERNKWLAIQLANAVPQFAPMLAKEVIKLSDWPEKDKLLREAEIQQQRQQQMEAMAAQEGQSAPQGDKRGPIQSSPRPSRGPKRPPQKMGMSAMAG